MQTRAQQQLQLHQSKRINLYVWGCSRLKIQWAKYKTRACANEHYFFFTDLILGQYKRDEALLPVTLKMAKSSLCICDDLFWDGGGMHARVHAAGTIKRVLSSDKSGRGPSINATLMLF